MRACVPRSSQGMNQAIERQPVRRVRVRTQEIRALVVIWELSFESECGAYINEPTSFIRRQLIVIMQYAFRYSPIWAYDI